MSRSRRRRIRGSRVIGSTHVCGSVSGIVPNVVHQGGEVLQAVWDVVRKEQDAHRLRTQSQGSNVASILTSVSTENKTNERRHRCRLFPVLIRLTAPVAMIQCRGCASSVWSLQHLSESQQSSLVCNTVVNAKNSYLHFSNWSTNCNRDFAAYQNSRL